MSAFPSKNSAKTDDPVIFLGFIRQVVSCLSFLADELANEAPEKALEIRKI